MSSPVNYHYGKFPPKNLDWEKLIPLIGPARAAVAAFDSLLISIPNASVLLSPMTTREAVLSSKIEGTQATMGEVLEFEADDRSVEISENKRRDINEIINYRTAMHWAVDKLKELPLCQRVIKGAHEILMANVRGADRLPGEYRRTPNWIGTPGCSIEEAEFVPISADKLPDAMSKWEKYIHEDALDKLVQLAIIHAEFESLHPFLDGNGRLGRMCIPLFMFKKGLISKPTFYISEYLENNRETYYGRLRAISQDNKWTDWCRFFLQAVTIQALINQTKGLKIIILYNNLKNHIPEIIHSQYSIQALDFIFKRPIFKSTDFVVNPDIPNKTARRILNAFRDDGIVKILRTRQGRQATRYISPELLNIVEGENIF
jgi:Fic family protein